MKIFIYQDVYYRVLYNKVFNNYMWDIEYIYDIEKCTYSQEKNSFPQY